MLAGASVSFSQANIDGLIKAERSFAAYSLAKGTKAAFLAYADTGSIMFNAGKPVNTHALWTPRPEDKGVLSWGPDYAEISRSGDFGITAGPWTYHAGSIKDTPAAHGHFATVWHRNGQGDWKFLVDLGIGYTGSWTARPLATVLPAPNGAAAGAADYGSIEHTFIQAYSTKGRAAYDEFLSAQSRLFHNGHAPALDPAARKQLLDAMPAGMQFTANGGGSSPAGDLVYAYGTVVHNSKTENYLRVWRREGGGWKMALETLR